MTAPAPHLRERMRRWYAHACIVGVLLAWHLPVLYHGVVSPKPLPGVPWVLHRCHDVTCLFVDQPNTRNHYYVQVRRVGRPDWQTLDVSEYFPMYPFGYRTRLERLLAAWGPKSGRAHDELARWLFARHHESHPEQRLLELRFLWTWVSLADYPRRQVAARAPAAESFPFDRRRVLSVHVPESP